MARKSSAAAPATLSVVHVIPPSIERATVPRAPLAHTILPFTALRPRSSAVVPLETYVHWAARTDGRTAKTRAERNVRGWRQVGGEKRACPRKELALRLTLQHRA